MLGSLTLSSLEYDLISSPIQQEQQLDVREFRSLTRANSPIFSRTSGWTRIAKFSWTQGVPAADEGLNLVMKSWRAFRRIRVFLRAQVSKLCTSSLILKKEKLLKTLENISIYLLAILYVLRCTVFDKSCQNISCCSNLQLDLEFH